jgi:MYXO-CTERM domain-containing protein
VTAGHDASTSAPQGALAGLALGLAFVARRKRRQ